MMERIENNNPQHITLHRPERDTIEVMLMSTESEIDYMKTDRIRFYEKVYRKWVVGYVMDGIEYGFFVIYHYFVPEFDRGIHNETELLKQENEGLMQQLQYMKKLVYGPPYSLSPPKSKLMKNKETTEFEELFVL